MSRPVLIACLVTACAHSTGVLPDEAERQAPPPVRPERRPLSAVQTIGQRVVPTSAALQVKASAGALFAFMDGSIGLGLPRVSAKGVVSRQVAWRSATSVTAFTPFTDLACLATADEVACLEHTASGLELRPKARLVNVVGLAHQVAGTGHLLLVAIAGSPARCLDLGSFSLNHPDAVARCSKSLAEARPVRRFIGGGRDPVLFVDEANELWTFGVDGKRQLLQGGVREATNECALMLDGTVQCWGANDLGQLGRGRRTDGPGLPAPVRGLRDVEQVASSGINACARTTSNEVWCWGANIGPDGLRRARELPRCRVQQVLDVPCPARSGGDDDPCARERFNSVPVSQRVVRDVDEQCVAEAEFVASPTKIEATRGPFRAVETTHDGVRLTRTDGTFVELTGPSVLELEVREER